MRLHQHQQALFELLKKRKGDLRGDSLRDIGDAIGVSNRPQVIAHHLQQLENKGYIRRVKSAERNFTVLKNPASEVVYVDLYRSTAQCGPDGLFGEDDIVDRIPLSSKTFGISNPQEYFLIRPKGTSMKPMIEEGDFVLAHKQNDIESGQVGVVVHNGMPKIKKIVKVLTEAGARYVLSSLNSSFDDEVVENEDADFRICGQVKGVLKVS